MKKLIILSFFTLVSLLTFGQTKPTKVDILWGPDFKSSSTLGDIIGHDKTGIYTTKTEMKAFKFPSLFIEHYDNKMTQTKSVKINMEQDKKLKEFEFFIHFNDNIYIFTSFKNQKLKRNFLFVQSINKTTLELNNDLRKVAEIDYSEKNRYNAGNFNYEVSRDSSKLLVYYNLPYDKGESEKFGFHVFDKDLKELWEKQIALPYKEELFDVEDYRLDNNGNVHLLGLIYNEKRKAKRDGNPNYKYQILSYYNNGNELKEYPVQVIGKFLTDMKIDINKDLDIVCGGFYSEEGSYSIRGSYFIKIDGKTKQIIAQNFKDFGIDFITQNMTESQENKAKKKEEKGESVELYKYSLDNIIIKEDGGAVLVGEQYYVRSVTSTNTDSQGRTTSTTNYYYYYNDIIVISISKEGDILWNQKIPKKQVTSNDDGFFSSYNLSVIKDKLYFVFNDNPKNLTNQGDGKLANFNRGKGSLVVLVRIDSDGKQNKQSLFVAKDVDILIRPSVSEQISKTETVLFGQRGSLQRFAKITFKE